MNLYSTSTTRILVSTACVALVAAASLREPIVILWMGSILLAITLVRGIASFEVAAARRQGFEMLLGSGNRCYTVTRTAPFEFEVVLRNRSDIALQVRDIRALGSPSLDLSVDKKGALISAHGSLNVKIRGKALRIGCGVVHGLFLRVLHASGAFEAPLVFFNPVQFLVYPLAAPGIVKSSRGGLSRRPSDADRSGRMSGDSIELRELRSYQPGDALRKLAWKASARRGTLLVRDEELLERQTVWVLVDASIELWGGTIGNSPLDEGIDRVASILHKHVSLGDRVGLGLLSSRVLEWIAPDSGMPHWARLRQGLLQTLQIWDADRCGSDEKDLTKVVAEHLARLEPTMVTNSERLDAEVLARAAASVLKRYEFQIPKAAATSEPERVLRQYVGAFGLACPLRLEAERWQTDNQLLTAIDRCTADKHCRIIVVSTEPTSSFIAAVSSQRRKLSHRRIRLSWLSLNSSVGMPEVDSPHQGSVNDAIRWQIESAKRKSRIRLKRVGIAVEHVSASRRRES